MNHHLGEAYYDIIDFDVYDGRNFLNPSYTEVR